MNPSKGVLMSQDDSGTTYSFNVCSQCKSICCQDAKPPLTSNRKKNIQEYMRKHNLNVKEPFAKGDYSYPAVDGEIYCRLFSKKTGKCMVHSVKPETCVAGPVTFDINFSNKTLEFFLKKTQICAYAGILYNDKAAFKEHFEVAKKQIVRLIKQLSAEELRAIVKIEEPQTFKFAEEPLPKKVVEKLGL